MVKAEAAPLQFAVANVEVRVSTERLNSLIDEGFRLPGILLIDWNRGSGLN